MKIKKKYRHVLKKSLVGLNQLLSDVTSVKKCKKAQKKDIENPSEEIIEVDDLDSYLQQYQKPLDVTVPQEFEDIETKKFEPSELKEYRFYYTYYIANDPEKIKYNGTISSIAINEAYARKKVEEIAKKRDEIIVNIRIKDVSNWHKREPGKTTTVKHTGPVRRFTVTYVDKDTGEKEVHIRTVKDADVKKAIDSLVNEYEQLGHELISVLPR